MRGLLFTTALILGLVAVEITLKVIKPFPISKIASVGLTTVPNAKKYGWGFQPGSDLPSTDYDTGEIKSGKINSHGWRTDEYDIKNLLTSSVFLFWGTLSLLVGE